MVPLSCTDFAASIHTVITAALAAAAARLARRWIASADWAIVGTSIITNGCVWIADFAITIDAIVKFTEYRVKTISVGLTGFTFIAHECLKTVIVDPSTGSLATTFGGVRFADLTRAAQ